MVTQAPARRFRRSRQSSSLIAERDSIERDIIKNNATISRLAVKPRWNSFRLNAARVVKRRLDREIILLGIEIDLALDREAKNMEWLMSLSQVSSSILN
jgi:hypothetical protein